MKAIKLDVFRRALRFKNVSPFGLLLLGIILNAWSHMTINIDFLGWISVVPFLLYLHLTSGIKSRLLFLFVLFLTWSVIVLKIITYPIPIFLVPLYSIPLSIIQFAGYMIYDIFRKHTFRILIFPAAMVTLEWLQYTYSPFGSWGVAAYTQVDSIHIVQIISIVGLSGLSFLIYWMNSAIADLFLREKRTQLNFKIPIILVFSVLFYGNLRLDIKNAQEKQTMKVAAVGTDSKVGGVPLPSRQSNESDIRKILERTQKAANTGAKLVVWNEAAFYLLPDNEEKWVNEFSLLAKDLNIGLAASYVVLLSENPFQYENKFKLISPDGEIRHEYLKHEPVPGEPAVRGTEDIKTANIFSSNIGGAICYDYDFPYLAALNKEAGADIVVLPSSDWRGIDPLHTKMAAFRAVEQGQSVLRSTRFGLSAAINPYGEMVTKMSSYDNGNDKIMISELPVKGSFTIYSITGDIVVYISIGFLFWSFAKIIVSKVHIPLNMIVNKI